MACSAGPPQAAASRTASTITEMRGVGCVIGFRALGAPPGGKIPHCGYIFVVVADVDVVVDVDVDDYVYVYVFYGARSTVAPSFSAITGR